jgi:hypothetical protein
MVLDIAETPKINLLRVNGRLSFANNTAIHLRAKHVFVRAGELIIGAPSLPHSQARITLFGEKDARAIVYDNAIEAGNKNIANVGKVRIYGAPRASNSILTRLHQSASMGDTQIQVGTGLDWVQGDRVALAATSYHNYAGEDHILTAYNS